MTTPDHAARVEIHEADGRRIVEIHGRHWGTAQYVQRSRFETTYSRELIEALLEAKGPTWLRDEIDRAENPQRIAQPLLDLVGRFATLGDAQLLDFGAGCGGSSLILARAGARVTSVEPVASYAQVIGLRARDAGLSDRIAALHVPDTRSLPFADHRFDLITANGVLEHIPPALRRSCLQEAWRVLRPGGLLFVYESPNRLWPVDHHTTGLPLLPYLPASLAFRYARAASPRVAPTETLSDLVERGMIGVTYWEVLHALKPGDAVCLNVADGQDVPRFLALTQVGAGRGLRSRAKAAVFHGLDRLICRPLGLPAGAFFPLLSLCFRKGGG
ncbi:MAG: class I SAM-dependent methyltransferase [Chloroflexi bacterium]|nr:class I SAM-dependent methyltransferase [Chloroflexota bacterium]